MANKKGNIYEDILAKMMKGDMSEFNKLKADNDPVTIQSFIKFFNNTSLTGGVKANNLDDCANLIPHELSNAEFNKLLNNTKANLKKKYDQFNNIIKDIANGNYKSYNQALKDKTLDGFNGEEFFQYYRQVTPNPLSLDALQSKAQEALQSEQEWKKVASTSKINQEIKNVQRKINQQSDSLEKQMAQTEAFYQQKAKQQIKNAQQKQKQAILKANKAQTAVGQLQARDAQRAAVQQFLNATKANVSKFTFKKLNQDILSGKEKLKPGEIVPVSMELDNTPVITVDKNGKPYATRKHDIKFVGPYAKELEKLVPTSNRSTSTGISQQFYPYTGTANIHGPEYGTLFHRLQEDILKGHSIRVGNTEVTLGLDNDGKVSEANVAAYLKQMVKSGQHGNTGDFVDTNYLRTNSKTWEKNLKKMTHDLNEAIQRRREKGALDAATAEKTVGFLYNSGHRLKAWQGTIDIYGRDKKTGKIQLGDYKTGAQVNDAYSIPMSLYALGAQGDLFNEGSNEQVDDKGFIIHTPLHGAINELVEFQNLPQEVTAQILSDYDLIQQLQSDVKNNKIDKKEAEWKIKALRGRANDLISQYGINKTTRLTRSKGKYNKYEGNYINGRTISGWLSYYDKQVKNQQIPSYKEAAQQLYDMIQKLPTDQRTHIENLLFMRDAKNNGGWVYQDKRARKPKLTMADGTPIYERMVADELRSLVRPGSVFYNTNKDQYISPTGEIHPLNYFGGGDWLDTEGFFYKDDSVNSSVDKRSPYTLASGTFKDWINLYNAKNPEEQAALLQAFVFAAEHGAAAPLNDRDTLGYARVAAARGFFGSVNSATSYYDQWFTENKRQVDDYQNWLSKKRKDNQFWSKVIKENPEVLSIFKTKDTNLLTAMYPEGRGKILP